MNQANRCPLFYTVVVGLALFAIPQRAGDVQCFPMDGEVILDGNPREWTQIPAQSLEKSSITVAAARDSKNLYLLLRFEEHWVAHLIRSRSMTLWINGRGDHSKEFGIQYAGSKSFAESVDAGIPREVLPEGGERGPQPSKENRHPADGSGRPAGRRGGGNRPHPAPEGHPGIEALKRREFTNTLDPGLLVVITPDRKEIQLEKTTAGPSAGSDHHESVYCFEYAVPLSRIYSKNPEQPGAVLSLGIQTLDVNIERPVEVEATPGGMMGGGRGGGRGGNKGGSRPGTGGLSGGHGKQEVKQPPSYSLVQTTEWVTLALDLGPAVSRQSIH